MITRILGLNLGITSHGKNLADGAVALMINGRIESVISEERINKKKHSGGFSESLEVILKENSIDGANIDLVVVSNCCDIEVVPNLSGNFPNAEIISCNHHVSHALSSHCSSNFEKSLSIVLDGGGNVLSGRSNAEWWREGREQQSYFLIGKDKLDLLSRDFSAKYEMGFGEVFRAFTKFLGLGSSENAGKLMALAAYGSSSRYKHVKIFEIDGNGVVTSALKYSDLLGPQEAHEIVLKFLESHGFEVPDCDDSSLIEQRRADIAAWVQEELENAVFQKIKFLSDQYPEFPICISGGVGYNCRNNGNLLRKLSGRQIFFSPFAGDIGQCIGNVCFGNYYRNQVIQPVNLENTFLGTSSKSTVKELLIKFANTPNFFDYFISKPEAIYERIAELIYNGKVGALHEGRSEIGPRALGNRSILARGDCNYIRDRVNDIKCREQYMPLAPVILDTFMHDYFYLSAYSSYEFMAVAVSAKDFEAKKTCGFLHRDGTARIQVVNSSDNTGLSQILNSFSKFSEVPVIINTSFNGKSNPISEDVNDAVKNFLELDLDFLAVNGVLIVKSRNTYVPLNLREIKIFSDSYINFNLAKNRDLVSRKVGLRIEARQYFVLFSEYCRWFESGRKTTTIRYSGNVDLPVSTHLPMYENESYDDEVNLKYFGHVYICKLEVKKFCDLTNSDALNDGFDNLDQLRQELIRIYGASIQTGIVTIYHISISSFSV